MVYKAMRGGRRAKAGFILFLCLLITAVSHAQTAVTRHAAQLSGTVDGSLQQLTGESFNLNSGAVVTGDWSVPGTPNVQLNGTPIFGGTMPGSGSASPTGYAVTLNSGAKLGHLRTRTDPVTIPSVAAPAAPAGSRSVTLNSPGQNPGSFATLRNLTLNSNAGQVVVPAGTYGDFIANSGSGFTLGTAGATQPAVYNFQHFSLNGNNLIQVLGPVVVTVANGFSPNGPIGSQANSSWLTLRISSGDLNINSGSNVYGTFLVPAGAVTVNGNATLTGTVSCDRLTVNSGGLLRVRSVVTNQPPTATAATLMLDEDAPLAVTLHGSDPEGSPLTFRVMTAPAHGTLSGAAPNLTYTPGRHFSGTDSFTFSCNDGLLDSAVATVSLTIRQINLAPVVSAGGNRTIAQTAALTLTGTVTDDALPAGQPVTAVWSAVSGPGAVTFANSTAPATSVRFSTSGTYVLQLTASDTLLSGSDTATITVQAGNLAPVVQAGAAQTVTAPGPATLHGSVADDGLPSGSVLTQQWSTVSGPGAVTFGNASAAATTASFSAPGDYVLRLRATDSSLAAAAETTVHVLPANTPPQVSATAPLQGAPGADLPLVGQATDDGLPRGAGLRTQWMVLSGPGAVTVADPFALTTTARFATTGVYTLRLTASDSQLTGQSDVQIVIAAPANQPPLVDAGPDLTTTGSRSVLLHGAVTDDGLPAGGTLALGWSQVSGPGATVFYQPADRLHRCDFHRPGHLRAATHGHRWGTFRKRRSHP